MINAVTHTEVVSLTQNVLTPISFPTNVMIQQLKVTRRSGGAFTVGFYNRPFTSTPVDILLINQADELRVTPASPYPDKALLVNVASAHGLQLSDIAEITLSSEAGYNADDLLVQRVVDEFTVVLDAALIEVLRKPNAGKLALKIPATDYPNYLVATVTDSGWTNTTGAAIPYNSRGPEDNTGRPRTIWVSASATDTYVITADVFSDS